MDLLEQLGGRPTPAAGFACGLERLIELVAMETEVSPKTGPDVFVISESSELDPTGVKISELLRKQSIDVTFTLLREH